MAEGGKAESERHSGFNKRWFVKKEKAVEYQCYTCAQILDDPYQIINCGHQFCKLCLPAKIKKCPACGYDVKENEIFPDTSVQQKVLFLVIKCPFKHCTWRGPLKDFLEEHKEKCIYDFVTCPNEDCNQLIVKDDLPEHLADCLYRKEECPHCHEAIVFDFLKDHLEKDCLRVPKDCPQGCAKQIPNEEVKKHMDDECALTMVDCVYTNWGCVIKIQRRDAEDHERTSIQEHLRLAMTAINNVNAEKQRMTADMNQLKKENTNLRGGLERLTADHEKRIAEIEENAKQFKEQGAQKLDNIEKATRQNFDDIKDMVHQNGEFQDTVNVIDAVITQLHEHCASNEASIIKLFEEDRVLRSLSIHICNYFKKMLTDVKEQMDAAMDHVARKHDQDNAIATEFQETTEGKLDHITQAVAKNADELNTQKQSTFVLKDDTDDHFRNVSQQMERDFDHLAEKITNEKQERRHGCRELSQEVVHLKVASRSHGSFLWKIENVDSALRMAATDPREGMHGQSFYSWPNGYLMRPKLFLNGARQKDRSHISIFVQILKSANDALLQWPFNQRMRFTLVEQRAGERNRRDIQKDLLPNGDSEELQRPTNEANNANGIYNFVAHDMLLSGNYVVDDTMFIRVEVLETI